MFRNIFRYLFICVPVVVSLNGCGQAVELKNPVDKNSSSDPYVHITGQKEIVDGEEIIAVTWSSANVDFCIASGAWSGEKNLNGEDILTHSAGYQKYAITCVTTQGTLISEEVDLTESSVIPSLEFTATQQEVVYGGSTVLTWNSSKVDTCVAAGGWSGDQVLSGSLKLQNILQDQILTLTCSGEYGTISTFVLVLIDDSVTPELPELSFTTSSFQVSDNSPFTLSWSSKRAAVCKASGDWLGDKDLSASEVITSIDSSSRFILQCEGAGGTITRSLDVMLNTVSSVAPELNLVATPATVYPGHSTILQWSSNNVDSCEASGQWSGLKAVSGSEETVSLLEDGVFNLYCRGSGGGVTISKTVKVGDPLLSFTTSSAQVPLNTAFTLNWSSSSSTACQASGAWTGDKSPSGSEVITSIDAHSHFVLQCDSPNGTITRAIDVLIKEVVQPIPQLSLSANPSTVRLNQSSTLQWSSTNVDTCEASGEWSGAKSASGLEVSMNLQHDSVFNLSCRGPGGAVTISKTVKVADPELSFTATSIQVPLDTAFTLNWSSINSTSCLASGDWMGDKEVSGSETIVSIDADKHFVLQCEGPAGSIIRTVDVAVLAAPEITLTANPSTVPLNGSTLLQWSSSNADTCEASGQWLGMKAVAGTEVIANLQQDSEFTLLCTGPGGSISTSATVVMAEPELSFTSTSTQVPPNSAFTLKWSSRNSTSCQASGGWLGDKSVSGSESITSTDTDSHFVLQCEGPAGAITRTIDVVALAAPQLNLSVSPATVSVNDSTSLQWSSSNADSCEASGQWSGTKAASGTEVIPNLQQDSEFTLLCTGPGGAVSSSANVVVTDPVTSQQVELLFNASTTQVPLHTDFTLSWSSSHANTCLASGNWTGDKGLSGSKVISSIDEDSHFVLRCEGPAGSITRSVDVAVLAAPELSLTADLTTVPLYGSTTLQWSSDNTDTCEASGQWSGAKAVSGTEVIANLQQDSEFTLLCTGPGGSVTTSAMVQIAEPELIFTSISTQVPPNTAFTLNWSSSNSTSCQASGDWTGDKSVSGSKVIDSIDTDSHFVLQCEGPAGVITRTVDVVALAAPQLSLTADPTTVSLNGSTTLSWSSVNADTCEASGQWSGVKAVAGTEVIPNLQQDSEFTLLCRGPGGSVTTSVAVVMAEPEMSFSSSAIQVQLNTAFTLSWSSSNSSRCLASGDWLGEKSVSGSEVIASIDADSHFVLQCEGPAGSISRAIDVIVLAAPQLSLIASPASVSLNESTTLQWSSTNVDSCEASGQWSGTKAASGTEVIANLQQDSEFILLCTGLGGSISTTATVVIADPELSFTSSSTQVPLDTMFTLSWNSSNSTSCQASGDWAGDKNLSGSEVIASIDADSHFDLKCEGPAGSITRTVDVAALVAPQLSLTANPTTVSLNESTILQWSSSNADSCEASGAWTDANKALSGYETTQALQENSAFNLSCYGPGGSISISLTVKVITLKEVKNTVSRYITWYPPSKNVDDSTLTDLAGFRIYYGRSTGNYTKTITVNDSNAEQYLITDLTPGEWFFAMTAFNSELIESDYSSEIKETIE